MEYRERKQIPPCCEACGETSEAMCFICEHFHEKYVLADKNLVVERTRRHLIRKLLNVKSEFDYYVIRWRPVTKRPANYSYVLIEELDEELGTISCPASYENGKFWYFNNGGGNIAVDETRIMGWDYFPYDEHPDEKKDEMVDSVLGNLGKLIREEIEKMLEEPEPPQD